MSTAHAQPYAEGQLWSYKTRPNEPDSTLLIGKVERNARLGLIYHISVLGVSVRNRRAPTGVTHELPHFPVSDATLNASCIKLIGYSEPNPQFAQGYAEWRRAFDQGNAGVFTIPVSEIVDILETTINK